MARYAYSLVVLLAVIGLGASNSAVALEWPVRHEVLTATFGESRSGHFHDGIDIGGGQQAVHPAAAGEVVFSYEEGADPRDLPTGLGSFVVVQHNSEFRTLYAHLRRGSVLKDKANVSPDDVIGVIGDTGDSVGLHLHFEVIDQKKGEIVNPLELLPPLNDTQRPVVSSVSVERNKKLTVLAPRMVVPAGRVALVVDTYDPSPFVPYFDPMAPYEIDATLNGEEIFNVRYDSLQERGGKQYLVHSDNRSFTNYYVGTWQVRLGTFTLKPGAARLVVTARDIVGNAMVRTYQLTVQGGQ